MNRITEIWQHQILGCRAIADRKGGAAVEFALVMLPLMFVVFGIIELGIIFVANINLSNAVLTLSRQIRVGGIVAPGTATTSSSGIALDIADFKAAICNQFQMAPTATCLTQLQVDIRTQSAFSGQTAPNPLSGTNFDAKSLCFYSGTSGSIVTFRAYYLWPVATPILLSALVNASSYTAGGSTSVGNYYMLTSAETFKVEQNTSVSNNGSGC